MFKKFLKSKKKTKNIKKKATKSLKKITKEKTIPKFSTSKILTAEGWFRRQKKSL